MAFASTSIPGDSNVASRTPRSTSMIRTSGFSHRATTPLNSNVKPLRPHSASTSVRGYSRKRRSILSGLNASSVIGSASGQQQQQQGDMNARHENGIMAGTASSLHHSSSNIKGKSAFLANKRRNSLREEIYRNRISTQHHLQQHSDNHESNGQRHTPRRSATSINSSTEVASSSHDRKYSLRNSKSTTRLNSQLSEHTNLRRNSIEKSPPQQNSSHQHVPTTREPPSTHFPRPVTAPEHMKRRRRSARTRISQTSGSSSFIQRHREAIQSSTDTASFTSEGNRSEHHHLNSKENHNIQNHHHAAPHRNASMEDNSVENLSNNSSQLKPLHSSPVSTESKLRRGISARVKVVPSKPGLRLTSAHRRSTHGGRTTPSNGRTGDSDSLSSCSTIPLNDNNSSTHGTPSKKRPRLVSKSPRHSQPSANRRRSMITRNIGKCLNDFIIMDEIGSGGCGTVYKVKSKITHEIYVAKKVNVRHLTHKQLKDTLSEVYLMKEIHHQHIIQFFTSFVENHSLYILMEYAEAGDLHQYYRQQKLRRKYIKESFLWRIMYQTCLALQYLHDVKHIIHRDVKALNVFLSGSMHVKLGDLGMSRQVRDEQMLQTNVGTPAFLSPEQIRRKPYDFKVDVWGLGCVMYSLAALRPPFKGDNILELSRSIVHDEVSNIPKHYSPRLRSLIISMLAKSSHSRPSIQEIITSIPEHIREASSAGSHGRLGSSGPLNLPEDNFFKSGSSGGAVSSVGATITTGTSLTNDSSRGAMSSQQYLQTRASASTSGGESNGDGANAIQVKQPSARRIERRLHKKRRAASSRKKSVGRKRQWV